MVDEFVVRATEVRCGDLVWVDKEICRVSNVEPISGSVMLIEVSHLDSPDETYTHFTAFNNSRVVLIEPDSVP